VRESASNVSRPAGQLVVAVNVTVSSKLGEVANDATVLSLADARQQAAEQVTVFVRTTLPQDQEGEDGDGEHPAQKQRLAVVAMFLHFQKDGTGRPRGGRQARHGQPGAAHSLRTRESGRRPLLARGVTTGEARPSLLPLPVGRHGVAKATERNRRAGQARRGGS
jgi:hypothetical protein